MNYKLSPSMLSADFSELGQCIRKVETAGAEYLHIDVMDGCFVPSISFGMPVIASIRKHTSLIFDVHLMVEEPIRYLNDFAKAGADSITVHYEACKHLHRTIMAIKELGLKAGVALNPATSIDVLKYILCDLDLVLVMSVNPGFGGQKLIPSMIQKISDMKAMIIAADSKAELEVDGGITLENASKIIQAGADVIVAGTAVFSGDIERNIKNLRNCYE